MSEPAVTGGTQGEVTPGSSQATQEEPTQLDDKSTTPAPGVSNFNYSTLFLPCTIQCNIVNTQLTFEEPNYVYLFVSGSWAYANVRDPGGQPGGGA